MFVKHTLSFMSVGKSTCLQYPLCHHRFGYLHEARNICTFHVVCVAVGLFAVFYALFVDILHDAFQFGINLFTAPAQFLSVLRHFQTGNRYTAGIGCLGRSEQQTGLLEDGDGLGSGGHIGAFGHRHGAALDDLLRLSGGDLILSGAGQGDVAGDGPDAAEALGIGAAGDLSGVFLDAAPLLSLIHI